MPARYKDLTMPIGILYGTDDRILDPALHARGFVAKVPGTDLEMIEGAGHMLLISRPIRSPPSSPASRTARRLPTRRSRR